MTTELEAILEEIERDMSEDVARAFVRVATNYFNASANTDRPVSTRLNPDQIAARIDHGMPEGPTTVEDVIVMLERDVVAESGTYSRWWKSWMPRRRL